MKQSDPGGYDTNSDGVPDPGTDTDPTRRDPGAQNRRRFASTVADRAAAPTLREIAELESAIVSNAPDGILVTDANGTIVWANDQLGKIFGYTATELTGQALDLFLPPAVRHSHQKWREDFQRVGRERHMSVGGNLVGVHRDGSTIGLNIALSSLGGAFSGCTLAFVRDVSEHRTVRSRLAALDTEVALARERQRISADIHDFAIQTLFAAGLRLQSMAKRPDLEGHPAVVDTIDDLDEVVRQLRLTIFEIRPGSADKSPAMEVAALRRTARQMLGFEPSIEVRGDLDELPAEIVPQVLAVLREGLTNVARHASASWTTARIVIGDEVNVTIDDNGVGVPHSGGRQSGLRNLAERAAERNGSLTVQRLDEGGTRLLWSIPKPAQQP